MRDVDLLQTPDEFLEIVLQKMKKKRKIQAAWDNI